MTVELQWFIFVAFISLKLKSRDGIRKLMSEVERGKGKTFILETRLIPILNNMYINALWVFYRGEHK